MAKITMKNVKITATNGGTVHNYNEIEMTDCLFNFSERGIDFTVDESVNIIEQIVAAGYKEQLVGIIKELKNAKVTDQEEIVKKSFLMKMISGAKDIIPLIDIIMKGAEFIN